MTKIHTNLATISISWPTCLTPIASFSETNSALWFSFWRHDSCTRILIVLVYYHFIDIKIIQMRLNQISLYLSETFAQLATHKLNEYRISSSSCNNVHTAIKLIQLISLNDILFECRWTCITVPEYGFRSLGDGPHETLIQKFLASIHLNLN